MPQQAGAPHVMPPLSSTSRVLKVGLTPKKPETLKPGEPKLSQAEVSVLMKWVVAPRLLAVPGVANVSTYGLQPLHYQVLVRPRDLRDHGVTLEQVRQAVRQAALYPSAGLHATPRPRPAIQHPSRAVNPAALADGRRTAGR